MGPGRIRASADEMQALTVRLTAEKSEAIARLAAGIAHELRNPLAVILARVQLLKMSLKNGQALDRGKLEHAFETIEEHALRSSRTIESLSAFARPRVPDLVPLDVADAVRTALGALSNGGGLRAGIDVRVEVVPALPTVLADREQFMTALTELLRNAFDAVGGRGSIRVTVAADGTDIEVRVTDTGAGIAAHDAARIFEPFFSTKPGASGLGLPVAQTIAEAHGGRVALSATGDGETTFVLRLPLTQGARV